MKMYSLSYLKAEAKKINNKLNHNMSFSKTGETITGHCIFCNAYMVLNNKDTNSFTGISGNYAFDCRRLNK
jgi:uncharacterized protein YutD